MNSPVDLPTKDHSITEAQALPQGELLLTRTFQGSPYPAAAATIVTTRADDTVLVPHRDVVLEPGHAKSDDEVL